MIGKMRNMVLATVVLGSFGGMCAEDEERQSTASHGTRELACLAVFAGAVGAYVGMTGSAMTHFPKEVAAGVSPALYNLLLAAKPYAWLTIPSLLISGFGDVYLRKAAKTAAAKKKAWLGSGLLTLGALALVAGCVGATYAIQLRDMIANASTPLEIGNVQLPSLSDIANSINVPTAYSLEKAWYETWWQFPTVKDCYVACGLASLLATLGISSACYGYEVQP